MQRAAGHLAQPFLSRRCPQPRGDQDEQGRPRRALQRELERDTAHQSEDERTARQQAGEGNAGAQRLAIAARGDPREREPCRHRAEDHPGGADEQHGERHDRGERDRARVESRLALGSAGRIFARPTAAQGPRAGGARRRRRRRPAEQAAAVDGDLHRARERRPREEAGGGGQQCGGRPRRHERQVAQQRVVGAGVDVEPADDDPDVEARGDELVGEADTGAGGELGGERGSAGVQAPEERRGQCLRQRNPEAGRSHDGDGLQHRGEARAVADPSARALGHPRERHAAGERDRKAAGGHDARGEKRCGRHVGEPRGVSGLGGSAGLGAIVGLWRLRGLGVEDVAHR